MLEKLANGTSDPRQATRRMVAIGALIVVFALTLGNVIYHLQNAAEAGRKAQALQAEHERRAAAMRAYENARHSTTSNIDFSQLGGH